MKWIAKQGIKTQYEVTVKKCDTCGWYCHMATRINGKIQRCSHVTREIEQEAIKTGMEWLYEQIKKSYPDTRPTIAARKHELLHELFVLNMNDTKERLEKALSGVSQYLVVEGGE